MNKNPSCCECPPQALSLNDNTGDLSITQGNTVNLVNVIKAFETLTYVDDFSLDGNDLSLTYVGEDLIPHTFTVDLSAIVISGSNVDGLNLGTGAEVFESKVGDILQFRTLLGAGLVDVTQGANEITITGNPTFVEAGTNITVTGTGTQIDPYIIDGNGDNNYPTSLSFDCLTDILTLGRNGMSDLTADFADCYLKSIFTEDTVTIDFAGSGTSIDPLSAVVNVSLDPTNEILIFPDGIYAPLLFETGLISGGIVSWVSGYTFHVTAATYLINRQFYSSPAVDITLDPADPTLDRIDTFIVDTTGTATALTGTPSALPSEPPLDPATQIRLSATLVEAGTTQPSLSIECIYQENIEWTSLSSTVRINPDSLTTPCDGAKSINGTNVVNNDNIVFTRPGGAFNPNTTFTLITLVIKSKGAWGGNGNNARRITLQFQLLGSGVGNVVPISNGSYGFDSSNTTDCQIISIPLANFGNISSVDGLKINVVANNGNFGWFIDDICLQNMEVTLPPTIDLDEKVKVSSNDTVAGYLNGKLVAGAGITFTELNDGGNETLVISGASSLTFDNGLTRTVNNVQLGGTLLHDTTIDATSLYQLIVRGSVPNSTNTGVLSVTNSNAGGPAVAIYGTVNGSSALSIAVLGVATNNQIGVSGTSLSGTGVLGTSSSGVGISGISASSFGMSGLSTTGIGGVAQVNPASTNTLVETFQVLRTTSGTAANGIGGALAFYNELSNGTSNEAAKIGAIWSDVNSSTRTGALEFYVTDSTVPTRYMEIAGNGDVTLDAYPDTRNDGSTAKVLYTTSTGLLQLGTVNIGALGGEVPLTFQNALTRTGNIVEWGGTLLHDTTVNCTSLYKTIFTGSFSDVLTANNTGAGRAIFGNALSGVGVTGVSVSASGVFGTSDSGTGVQGHSNNFYAAQFDISPASISTVAEVMRLRRTTTGTATTGIGHYISHHIETDNGIVAEVGRERLLLTDAGAATRTSQLEWFLSNSGSLARKYAVKGNGDFILDAYPDSRSDGSTSIALYTDASGNLKLGPVVPTGTSLRFGVATEDDVATQVRDFDLDTFTFLLHGGTGSSYVIRSTDIAGAGALSELSVDNIQSFLRSDNNVGNSATVTCSPTVIDLFQSSGSYTIQSLSDDVTADKVMVWNSGNQHIHSIDLSSIISPSNRFAFSGEDDTAAEARDFNQQSNPFTFEGGDSATFNINYGTTDNSDYIQTNAGFTLTAANAAATADISLLMSPSTGQSLVSNYNDGVDDFACGQVAGQGAVTLSSVKNATGGNSITVDTRVFNGVQVQLSSVGSPFFQINNLASGSGPDLLVIDGSNKVWKSNIASLIAASDTNFAQNDLTANGNRTHTFGAFTSQITYNSLGGASGLKLSSTSTAAASGAQRLFEVSLSGANSTSSQNTYGAYIVNSHTGTGAVNYGIWSEIQNGGVTGVAVQGTATTQQAIRGDATTGKGVVGNVTSGTGVLGSATSGTGGNFTATSGTGVLASATTGLAGWIQATPTTTNTTEEIFRIERLSSGTAANNIGGSVNFYTQHDGGTSAISNQVRSIWTTAASATRTSEYSITGIDAAISKTLQTISGNGQHKFNQYGVGTFTGTPAFTLQVDSTGKIIEGTVTDTNFAQNDLTATGNRTHTFAANTCEITYNSLAGASGFKLSSTSTAAASGLQKLLDVSLSGANSNSSQSTYGISVSNIHTGTNASNFGVYALIQNGLASGAAIKGEASTQQGVYGIATSGSGVVGSATSGNGVVGIATSGIGGSFDTTGGAGTGILVNAGTGLAATIQSTNTGTNDVSSMIQIKRLSTGTAANGIGGSIDFYNKSSDNTAYLSSRIISTWTDVTTGTRTGDIQLFTTDSAVSAQKAVLTGAGVFGLGKYTSLTATRAEIVDDAIGGSSMVKLTSTSTAAASNAQKLLEIALSGANSTSTQTTYGAYISNAHSGTSVTNYGLYSTISNEGSTSAALYGNAAAGGNGVTGVSNSGTGVAGSSGSGNGGTFFSTSGIGLTGSSSSSTGATISSSTGLGASIACTPATTNTIVEVLRVQRGSSGTPSNGIGGAINYFVKTDTSTVKAGQISCRWTDATHATRTSEIRISALNSAADADIASFFGDGSVGLYNGTAPAASITNGVLLYSEDVSSSAELKVRDEAGNVTTLSPHNFSKIPEGPSEKMAWAYYSENGEDYVSVDMMKVVRLLEKMTGEKLIHQGKK